MSHRYTRLRYHYVFATKNRETLISAPWQPKLHAYFGGVARNLEIVPIMIGGVADHVHAFVEMPPTLSVSMAIMKLKANTSKWLNEQPEFDGRFAWQEGYGAFTVGESQVAQTIRYIEQQAAHHKKRTFQDELKAFAKKHGLEWQGDGRVA